MDFNKFLESTNKLLRYIIVDKSMLEENVLVGAARSKDLFEEPGIIYAPYDDEGIQVRMNWKTPIKKSLDKDDITDFSEILRDIRYDMNLIEYQYNQYLRQNKKKEELF